MLSVHQAQTQILERTRPLDVEHLTLSQAGGRVLAQDVVAPISLPGWDNSAMDGYAVSTAAVPTVGTVLKVSAHIAAGDGEERELELGTAARIFTGALVPSGADAIVLQEDTVRAGDRVTIQEVPQRGQHIRRAGEDIEEGQTVLVAGRLLSAGDLSCLASLGVTELPVYRRPIVHLMTSGSELLRPGQGRPKRGQVIDGNTTALAHLVNALGFEAKVLPVIRDDAAATHGAVAAALSADVLITTGGVSVGAHDHVRGAIQAACGDGFGFWKVAVKPGKPLVFGQAERCTVFGLPGNPVSALVTFELFVRPALLRLAGHERCRRRLEVAELVSPVGAGGRREEYLRARCWSEDGRLYVDTNRIQSSGALSSIAGADALAIVRPGHTARAAGEQIEIIRWDSSGLGA